MNAGIDNLKTRREHLTEQFFLRNVLNEKSSLHYLLSLSLSAAQQAWRHQHCQQTSPRKNIWTIHKPELKDSKNRSSRTVLHISNSIYGRYTLFNWLLVLAWTLYF